MLARSLRRNRHPLLLLWAAFVALAALGLPRLHVDNGLEVWFAPDDPQLQAYRAFQRDFGHDEALFVLLPADSGRVSGSDLERLRSISRALEALPDVREVRSLSTVLLPRAGEDWLQVAPLLPAEGPLPEAEAVLAEALADPLLSGTAVTAAADGLLLEARLTRAVDDDARRDAVLAEIRQVLAPHAHHLAGVAVLTQALNALSRSEGTRLYGLALGVVLLGLGWAFGRARPALLSAVAVAGASVATLGLAGWTGRSLNLVTMVVPTLVLVLGVADCVHLLLAVEETPEQDSLDARVVGGLERVLAPCGLTTLTTALGLASLAAAPMPVLQELGLLGAAGVAWALVSSVICVAALPGTAWVPATGASRRAGALAGGLARLATAAPRRTLAVTAGIAALLGASSLGVTVDTDSAALLPPDHPVRQDLDAVERAVGGVVPLEVQVQDPAGVLRPPLLQAVEAWLAEVRSAGVAPWSTSLVPALQRLDGTLGGPGSLPADPAQLDQLLLLYGGSRGTDLDRLVRPPDVLRVTFGAPLTSAAALQDRTEALLARADLPPGATATPAGYVPLYVAKMDRITTSTLRSFGTSLLAVFGVLVVALRSVGWLVWIVPVNLLPVAAVFGGLAWTGRPLDAATSTVAAIVLGLVVDDTVHQVHRLREGLRTLAPDAAARAAARSTGRALVATTGVLAAGLGVLATAQVGAIAAFGLWSAVALLVALAADLLVLPAGVTLWHPRAR